MIESILAFLTLAGFAAFAVWSVRKNPFNIENAFLAVLVMFTNIVVVMLVFLALSIVVSWAFSVVAP